MWLSKNLGHQGVVCKPSNFHAFLVINLRIPVYCCWNKSTGYFQSVTVDNPNSKVAKAAHDAIRDAVHKNSSDKDLLVKLIWHNLPFYLMRASGQDAEGTIKIKIAHYFSHQWSYLNRTLWPRISSQFGGQIFSWPSRRHSCRST